MGHWVLPLPGRWSCHALHVKACILIKFHQLIIPINIVTIFNSMRWERCDTFKGPILEELSWERPRWVGKMQRLVLANQPSPTSGFIGCFFPHSEVLSQSRWNWVNHKLVSWSSNLFSIWILCILENMGPYIIYRHRMYISKSSCFWDVLKNEIVAPLYIISKAWPLQLCWKWEFETNCQQSQNHYRIYASQPRSAQDPVCACETDVCISGQILRFRPRFYIKLWTLIIFLMISFRVNRKLEAALAPPRGQSHYCSCSGSEQPGQEVNWTKRHNTVAAAVWRRSWCFSMNEGKT